MLGMLSEMDIQEWFDEKSPTDLVGALYQILDSSNWANELCIPEQPVAKQAADIPTECMSRPPALRAAANSVRVGTLLAVIPPPLCDYTKPPARPFDSECHTVQTEHRLPPNAKQMHRMAQRRDFLLREFATREPSGNRLSEKRSERASKRPRGARGRYLPQEQEVC